MWILVKTSRDIFSANTSETDCQNVAAKIVFFVSSPSPETGMDPFIIYISHIRKNAFVNLNIAALTVLQRLKQ